MDKETKEEFERFWKRLGYLEKDYFKEIKKIKDALVRVCSYKSSMPLVEIGRENLTSDIDNEVMPLIEKAMKRLEWIK